MLARYLQSIWEYRIMPAGFYRLKLTAGQYVDLSETEREKLVRYARENCFSGYVMHHADELSLHHLVPAGINIGGKRKEVEAVLGPPLMRRISRIGRQAGTWLLYKCYLVERLYPCTISLYLEQDRLTYAAFDFTGPPRRKGSTDPRFPALFAGAHLPFMKAGPFFANDGAFCITHHNSHLVVDHRGCLKVRMLEVTPA